VNHDIATGPIEAPVRRFTSRDGAHLAYREIGAGPPVLLLHGFLATGRQWLDHGHAGTLAKTLANAQFTTVPGDHWTALAQPTLTMAIADFLADTPR
jgi:hypothetical protein